MSLNTINIFISHSWSYSHTYYDLCRLLEERPYFAHKNYSVPPDDPIHNAGSEAELERQIENQINKVSVVLILAGVYATYSRWINKEVRIAKRLGKRIIAVEPWGAEKTSQFVKENADKIVKWNADSIVDAIRGN
ncbi:TIR domain-containing protein [Candidatus Avelusimicrobium fimicolum]|uniref:TIR domain-containing protein n=1 Tax=Candidatus Avelusimicrobium fimicolum TaxID=3416216 RepID=UPI0015A7F0EC